MKKKLTEKLCFKIMNYKQTEQKIKKQNPFLIFQ